MPLSAEQSVIGPCTLEGMALIQPKMLLDCGRSRSKLWKPVRLGNVWRPWKITLSPESLLPSSVSVVRGGFAGDGTGGCTAGADDCLEAALFWTSASRRREALERVALMLASCRPRRPFMASEVFSSMALVKRLMRVRRRARVLVDCMLIQSLCACDGALSELTVLKRASILGLSEASDGL